MNVLTHNPWGEYGHEEHVQIFRVLRALQDEIEFGLWVPNYCSDRALPLATRYFSREATDYIRFATDKDYATKLAELYIQEGCWTWADAWAWFDEECFIEASSLTPGEAAYSHLFPLNLFKFGAASGGEY
jgi:hypothetical protein